MSMMDQENRARVAGKISFYGIVGMRSFINRRLDVRCLSPVLPVSTYINSLNWPVP